VFRKTGLVTETFWAEINQRQSRAASDVFAVADIISHLHSVITETMVSNNQVLW